MTKSLDGWYKRINQANFLRKSISRETTHSQF